MMRALALTVVICASGVVFSGPPQLQALKQGADRAWQSDIEGWANYAFERRVTRRSFDKDGNTKFREEMRFRVTPDGEGFDEELLEIDGRQPTPSEIKEQRGRAIFTKHYRQADTLNLENPLGEDLALLPIIQAQDHQLFGEDQVNGIACYRTTFEARPEPSGLSIRERLKYAIKGSACFSTEGLHLVEFEMETVRSLKKGPVAMNHLRMTIQGQPVGDAWLPKLVMLRSDVVAFGKRLRKANTWQYSDFRYQSERKP